MVFVADDLGAWLIFILAEAGRKKLTALVLGDDQERALRSAATAAVEHTASELRPGDAAQAEHVALVISQVFSEPTTSAPLAGQATVLEALQTGIAGQLAVLDDASMTGTGQSSADVLGVAGTVVAQNLTGHLLREIVVRGSRGGPLFPLASQLNNDVTHLQGQRIEAMVGQLANKVRQALAHIGTTHAVTAAPTALAQLPAATVGFTGRDDELAVLAGLLDPAGTGPELVSAVAGLAGVGKTTLAVEAGHMAVRRGWFGGGVLFIDLHGYDEAPVQPEQALDALLRALRVPVEHIPPGAEERAGLYRSVLAQIPEPVLVITDNASTEAQVRPLLPGTGPHKVLITSRHTLAGLGTRLVDITVLDSAAGVDLLDTALRAARPGDERILRKPQDAARLAGLCGGLPLALQIIAAQLKADPALSAAELAEELAVESMRLEQLAYDDGSGFGAPSVAAAFELSYQRLEENAARVFRLLPVNPGPDLSTAAAAVLVDLSVTEARRVLAGLARAHLVEAAPGAKGRWRMHDLVRLYAQQLSDACADTDDREQARDRLLGYMYGRSRRHGMVLEELVEWWEDLSRSGIGSQAVIVPVPSRWGRTTLLERFAAIVEKADVPSVVVRIAGTTLPDGAGLQSQALRDRLMAARVTHQAAELLGADRLGGAVQVDLSVGALVVSPRVGSTALLAGIGVGAAGRMWDDTPTGQQGVVARAARAVAGVSKSLPVVVVIDDADRLEPGLTVTLVENLIERHDGQVLVVAAANPASPLASDLISQSLSGLVHVAEADADMSYWARTELAAELSPSMPAIAVRRVGQRTRTFAEVFVAASADCLADLNPDSGQAIVLAMVDEVIDAQITREAPSIEAVVLAWAGGVLHARQADRALAVLGVQRSRVDNDVVRFESLVRLADPASRRLAEQVGVLPAATRHRLAAAMLDTAAEVGADPGANVAERVVAWRTAHRVRADLDDGENLAAVQCDLVRGLEELGDLPAARDVADAALAEYLDSHPVSQPGHERDELSTAVLRLAAAGTAPRDDPLIETAVAFALEGGAAVGLEARIWAAIDLLAEPEQRTLALSLVDQVIGELEANDNLGTLGNRWRLLLAFRAGRVGHLVATHRLLAPMLDPDLAETWDAAQAVLYAVGGPRADARLQIVVLEAELAASPDDADDDRLRLHAALAKTYAEMGNYRQALDHGECELRLRRRRQSADHPATLTTRSNIAIWTGHCGDAAEALRLSSKLLPDQERVLGPRHRDTSATRNSIASFREGAGFPSNRGDFLIADSCNFAASSDYRTPVHSVP